MIDFKHDIDYIINPMYDPIWRLISYGMGLYDGPYDVGLNDGPYDMGLNDSQYDMGHIRSFFDIDYIK